MVPLDPTEPSGIDLTTLSLCDYANVREGLLNITSGGIDWGTFRIGNNTWKDSETALGLFAFRSRVRL